MNQQVARTINLFLRFAQTDLTEKDPKDPEKILRLVWNMFPYFCNDTRTEQNVLQWIDPDGPHLRVLDQARLRLLDVIKILMDQIESKLLQSLNKLILNIKVVRGLVRFETDTDVDMLLIYHFATAMKGHRVDLLVKCKKCGRIFFRSRRDRRFCCNTCALDT